MHLPRTHRLCVAVLCGWLAASIATHAQDASVDGTVVDPNGGAIVNARLVLHSAHGAPLREARSDAAGAFRIHVPPSGSYFLEVDADAFESRRVPIDTGTRALRVQLGLAPITSEISVTAERGRVTEVPRTTALVTSVDADVFRRQLLPTIGHALIGAPGVMIQQSAYGQVSPFLRGLTGYQVLNLVDGVRFNNTTFRSGPNQYLAFADPSQVDRIESMLGPSSAQFGSDAMGGAIQLLTPVPRFVDIGGVQASATGNLSAASADGSLGSDAAIALRGSRTFFSLGGSWREVGDVRAGHGTDSHHVFRRLFGLTDAQIRDVSDSRQRDTGFSQGALHAKLAVRVRSDQMLTAWYQASTQRNVRGYKDLWGGLGRLRSDFTPQRLQFLYGRYEALAVRGLDTLTGTVSLNAQTDGSVRQNLRATDAITSDRVKVNAVGYAGQATARLTRHDRLVFGGELYNEQVDAIRDVANPVTGIVDRRRALYPNGSTYRTTGLFIQDAVGLVNDRLTVVAGGRFTHVGVRTVADRNRAPDGRNLGVADSSQSFHDWTYSLGLTWRPTNVLSLNALHGRGFRAPNLNDLGAVGLNDLGYEIPAADALVAGALVGVSDGEGVASSDRLVERLRAERLMNYEVGTTLQWRRAYARVHFFDAELYDAIVRRTLLFPLSAMPSNLAGLPVSTIAPNAAQQTQGVASVATTVDPRALKAFVNEGRTRYRGIDAAISVRPADRWGVDLSYSLLSGHELAPTRPVRRLPPQQGYVAVRYLPGTRLSWIEMSAQLSDTQTALSGGDVTDERIGGARRRSDITDFFQGARASPYLGPGADGQRGTADDVFAPTGETVAQIRDRVLPLGATVNGVTVLNDGTRVPLYTQTAGFMSLNIGAGFVIAGPIRLDLSLTNVTDRNYRIHGSGVDSPGINVFARLHLDF